MQAAEHYRIQKTVLAGVRPKLRARPFIVYVHRDRASLAADKSEDAMSSRVIETTIDVSAPVERAWRILTDFGSFPQWSRFIPAPAGESRPGRPLSVRLDDGSDVLGASFLFSGEHYFRLHAPPGGTLFTHGEIFGGLFVPLHWKRLDTKSRGFEDFNAALRDRAEMAITSRQTRDKK